MEAALTGRRIHVTGVVQGVGFRPFVYGLAVRLGLRGEVCNTSGGVDIDIAGTPEAVEAFVRALTAEAPPLARIDTVDVQVSAPNGHESFEIRESVAQAGAFQPISPDVALCADCARELFDPADRRYLYPFINCTNCGPRFTIIRDIPYDRPATTMAPFAMCPDCGREYRDPLDRRFHAQPVACPACGPEVWLESHGASGPRGLDAILAVRRLLREGAIVAVKGLGGFHLACDATNAAAVAELRRRKGRSGKPFAVMLADLATAAALCEITPAERALLAGREQPIVLLAARPGSPIAPEVAPGVHTLGAMLPYTPLHHLLINRTDPVLAREPAPNALVMTSGNFSEEPIATDNAEALARLAPLADAFLLHDRDIHLRCDDSVVRVVGEREMPLRRSRGYAPYPVRLPFAAPPLLAAGAELKNTFCVTREGYAFVSQHIGDMENYETLRSFEGSVTHFERLFRVRPERIAYDLHPNYLATRYALERAEREGLPAIAVQHHHAHAAACMAENGLDGARPVIGVSLDGTGYGTDGAIWGGEFLVADYRGFERAAHLAYVPLPGGDAAVRHPYRMALAYLRVAGVEWAEDLAPVAAADTTARAVIAKQISSGPNAPPTSSMGRLFDAVAAIAGVRQSIDYEGQAAIELEALADPSEHGLYPYAAGLGPLRVDALVRALVADVRAGVPAGVISARFHRTIAALVRDTCLALRAERGLDEVALSGGVFQNVTLLEIAREQLLEAGFNVYTHHLVPANDGGLALGQAAVAAHAG